MSSPAVSGELVVVGGKDGHLYAWDIPTGELRWKVRAGQVITSPPVIGESVVYIQSGGVVALDNASGKIVWEAWVGSSVQSAPVISGKSIYIASNDGEVYALE
jgi:outer membrane protein assembly factor BamB